MSVIASAAGVRPMWKLATFSVMSGLLWSLMPAAGYWPSIAGGTANGAVAFVVLAAIITAYCTSLVVLSIRRRSRTRALWLGISSLPIGTFLFGVINECLQGLAIILTGGAYGLLSGDQFNPLGNGLAGAILCFFPPVCFILIPLAVLTTKVLLMMVEPSDDRGLTQKMPEFSGP